MKKLAYLAFFSVLVSVSSDSASAAEPGWSPVIVATGSYREQIQSTPIEKRPYRPFHFYGNAVRRNHYHGSVIPVPQILTRSRLIPSLGLLR